MRRHHRQGAKATSAAPLLYLLLIVLIAFTLLVATIILQSREKSGGLYDKLGKFVMAAAAAGKASLKGGELTSAVSEKHIKRDAEASSTVFFDWPHSSDFFGYANYKALESHLTHFDKMSTKGVQMGSRAFSVYTFKVRAIYIPYQQPISHINPHLFCSSGAPFRAAAFSVLQVWRHALEDNIHEVREEVMTYLRI